MRRDLELCRSECLGMGNHTVRGSAVEGSVLCDIDQCNEDATTRASGYLWCNRHSYPTIRFGLPLAWYRLGLSGPSTVTV